MPLEFERFTELYSFPVNKKLNRIRFINFFKEYFCSESAIVIDGKFANIERANQII